MWKTKLCLCCTPSFELSVEDQITLFAKVGFDGFFTAWRRELDMPALRRHADELGMLWQSVHAPYSEKAHAASLWDGGEAGDIAVGELIACARSCAEYGVPLMVCHTFLGFDRHTPTAVGIGNFGRVVREAERLGVKIAFENTEGEEYLMALMEAFRGEPHVGFCWDTGHEMCYNGAKVLTAFYGERLFGTHLNDNLGVRDYGGVITPKDDLHLLPFDGIADWEELAGRLARIGWRGPLTFELKRNGRTGSMDTDLYAHMPVERYVTEAYKRACRVAVLVQRAGGYYGGRA